MCVECTNTNNEFEDKIVTLTEQMRADAVELTSLQGSMANF